MNKSKLNYYLDKKIKKKMQHHLEMFMLYGLLLYENDIDVNSVIVNNVVIDNNINNCKLIFDYEKVYK